MFWRSYQTIKACVSSRAGSLLVVSMFALGCARTPIQAAVHAGDVDGLRVALRGAQLSPAAAQRAAYQLMRAELKTATGREGLRQIEGLEPCLGYFRSDLAYRAVRGDMLAAHVARRRIAGGFARPLAYVNHVQDPEDGWRAAAARSLTSSSGQLLPKPAPGRLQRWVDAERAGVWRRRLLLDPSSEVRLAAARAAEDAADPEDEDSLLEAARLDPSPEVRHAAISALGARGGARSTSGLRDLWSAADQQTRNSIVRAWAHAAAVQAEHGEDTARARLERVVDYETGAPAVLAALAVIDEAKPATADLAQETAVAVLAREIDHGATPGRLLAIRGADLSWSQLAEAVKKASDAHDLRVVVAALSRMAESPEAGREPAVARLLSLARGKGLVAFQARRALARVGDLRATELLEKDLKAKSWLERSEAAADLVTLGRLDKAVHALADQSAYVRARTACALIAWRGGSTVAAALASSSADPALRR